MKWYRYHYYPFMVRFDRCNTKNCNNLDDPSGRISVPYKTRYKLKNI